MIATKALKNGRRNGQASGGASTVAKKQKEPEVQRIHIVAPQMQQIEVVVEQLGDSTLIQHAFSEKAWKQMEQQQQGKTKVKARPPRNPKADFENAKELTKDGEPGISAIRFKCGCVDVCRTVTSLPMTEARRAIFVEGKVLPLKFKKCIMRTDIIRLPNGAPDLRYRPEYHGWSVKLRINFNSEVLSAEDVVNLLSRAGQFEGVCEWRPGKSNSGTHGMFKVTSVRNSN